MKIYEIMLAKCNEKDRVISEQQDEIRELSREVERLRYCVNAQHERIRSLKVSLSRHKNWYG